MIMEGDRNIKYNLYLVLVLFYFCICFTTSCSVYENDEYERTYISRYFKNVSKNYEFNPFRMKFFLVHLIIYHFYLLRLRRRRRND